MEFKKCSIEYGSVEALIVQGRQRIIASRSPCETREHGIDNNSTDTDWIRVEGTAGMRTNANVVPCAIFAFNRSDST